MTLWTFIAGCALAFLVGGACFVFGPEVGLACLVAVLMLAAVAAIMIDEYESRSEKEIPTWKE